MRQVLRFYFLEATPDNGYLVPMRLWFTLATTATVIFLVGLWRFDGSREYWLFVMLSPPVGAVAMMFVIANYRKARAFHAARAAPTPAVSTATGTRRNTKRRRGKL